MEVVFVELFVFKDILPLSATARNEKNTFSSIFLGYITLWFVYAPYMLNVFCILNMKAVVKILKIQMYSKMFSIGPEK